MQTGAARGRRSAIAGGHISHGAVQLQLTPSLWFLLIRAWRGHKDEEEQAKLRPKQVSPNMAHPHWRRPASGAAQVALALQLRLATEHVLSRGSMP